MSENKWPMNPVDPVENPKAAVKVGDHVKVTEAGESQVAKKSDTGVVIEIQKGNRRPYGIKMDNGDVVIPAWVVSVELLPVPAMNGCEKCTSCPPNAKKGDKCKRREETGNVGDGKWGCIGADIDNTKLCSCFVQKTCQNCGELQPDGDCQASVDGRAKPSCSACRSNPYPPRDFKKEGDWWKPKAEPAQEPDTIGKFISHQWLQKGMEDNFECPKHGGDNYNLIAQSDAGQYLVACGDCIKDRLKALESERKSGAAGNIAPLEGYQCSAVYQCGHYKKGEEIIEKLELRAEKAEKERDAARAEIERQQQINITSVAKRAALEKRVEELEELKSAPLIETISKERDAALLHKFKGREIPADAKRCPGCGTEFPVEEQKVEPHVPKWARAFTIEACQSCKESSRLRAILGYPYGCADCDAKKCRPRYTRQQRHAMSLKGQLKAAHKDRKEKDVVIACLKKGLEANAKEYHKKYAATEQKGLDAVAKTVEKDTAILANNDARWSNLVKRLEEKLAASVPLVNAIPCDIVNAEIVEDKHGDGSVHVWQRLRVSLQRDVIFHEPRTELVVFKKAREEKPDGS